MDAPSPADMLKAALEKIVFFEWRLKEMSAELAAAQTELADARKNDGDLAQFISELRNEVIALRDHQKKCETLLAQNGIAPPAFEHAGPKHEADPIEQARQLWNEGRLASPVKTTHFAAPAAPAPGSVAQRALADQCLRSLESGDSARREQAARHLVELPMPSAVPVLMSALQGENDHKARAQIARALIACGADDAAEMVAILQSDDHALVRLAALEALCTLPKRARAAIERAATDTTPAIRRRAAALSVTEGLEELFDGEKDESVRAVIEAAHREAAPPPRDAARAALHVLSQGGAR